MGDLKDEKKEKERRKAKKERKKESKERKMEMWGDEEYHDTIFYFILYARLWGRVGEGRGALDVGGCGCGFL